MYCPVQHGNLILCAAASSLLISQEPPKPVTWFFFVSVSHPSLPHYSLLFSVSLSLSCWSIRTSHKWTEERSMTKSRNEWREETANCNLPSCLEAETLISFPYGYIKEYITDGCITRNFSLFFQSYSGVQVLQKRDKAICLYHVGFLGRRKCGRQSV